MAGQDTGVGARLRPRAYWTFTVPFIPEWFVHWYENSPTVSKVRLEVPDVKFPMLPGAPAAVANVTLCGVVPASLFHVTVPPFVMVTVDGENENVAEPYPSSDDFMVTVAEPVG
jgi:hypothetical protein